jgi:hypothetical protein
MPPEQAVGKDAKPKEEKKEKDKPAITSNSIATALHFLEEEADKNVPDVMVVDDDEVTVIRQPLDGH